MFAIALRTPLERVDSVAPGPEQITTLDTIFSTISLLEVNDATANAFSFARFDTFSGGVQDVARRAEGEAVNGTTDTTDVIGATSSSTSNQSHVVCVSSASATATWTPLAILRRPILWRFEVRAKVVEAHFTTFEHILSPDATIL